ncbi:hypothetical protein AVEN_184996-2-1, partial [Araneus ventricosus]
VQGVPYLSSAEVGWLLRWITSLSFISMSQSFIGFQAAGVEQMF